MRSALYGLIRMAIEMASEAAAFFVVVDYLSCITVSSHYELTASYTIARYYVFS
jgi:hypothetical protein